MKKSLLFLSCLIFSTQFFAQTNPQWMYFSEGSHITCIEEDSLFIWVGTTAGLVQIAKQSMQINHFNKVTSDIPFNQIKKLYIDRSNRLWVIGSGNEIQLANYDGIKWTAFKIPEFGYQYELDLTDIVQTSDGKFWVGDWEGLVFFDENYQVQNGIVEVQDSSFINVGRVFSLEADDNNNLYIGVRITIQKMDSLGNMSPWGQSGMMDEPAVIKQGQPGVFWVGTQNGDFVVPSVGSGEVYYFANNVYQYIGNPPYNFSRVSDICFGPSGELYVATSGQGVVKYLNGQFSYLTRNNPLVESEWTTAVHMDVNGDLWAGTLNGLYKISNNVIQRINTSNSSLTSNNFGIYQKNDGTLLLQAQNPYMPFQQSTNNTLIINNQDTIIPFSLRNNIGINWKHEDASGNLWGITNSALYRLADTNLYVYIPDTSLLGSYYYLYDFCYDSINQKFWIGTDNELISFSNNTFSFESYFMNQPGHSVTAVFADSTGELWTGSNGSGVATYYNHIWTSHNFSWTLFNDYIFNITEDKNHALWFNSMNGSLGKFSNNSWTIYNHYNSPLPYSFMPKPIFDKNNTLYIIDNYKGIKILKNNYWDSIMIINSNLELFSSTLFFDHNDNLWILGNGITIYNPDGIVLGLEAAFLDNQQENVSLVYPNPTNEAISLKLQNANQFPLKVSLYSQDGRMVLTQTLNESKEINISHLTQGIYMILIQDSNNSFYTDKVLIRK